MKNIYEILALCGLTVSEEKKAEFEKLLFASYKSAAELEKKDQKLSALQQEMESLRQEAHRQEDAQQLKERITQLEQELSQQQASFDERLQERDFSHLLERAIQNAKGRNPKAILALLDRETLKQSEDREKDVLTALEQLRQTDGYLFEDPHIPPPYARGTGSQTGAQKKMPATLAGALKERFEMERK